MLQIRRLSGKSDFLARGRRKSLLLLGIVLISLTSKKSGSAAGSQPTDASPDIKSIKSRGLKILLVDDNTKFSKALSMVLKTKYAAHVEARGSGEAGIEAVRGGKIYDLIMIDLLMPLGKDGLQTYRELAGMVGTGCRFALMSARPDSKEWDEASRLGVPMLEKPILPGRLIALLNDCGGSD